MKSDSQFAVLIALLLVLLGAATGAVAVIATAPKTAECSIEIEYAGSHRAVYLTECKL